jgi:hypothetical protein
VIPTLSAPRRNRFKAARTRPPRATHACGGCAGAQSVHLQEPVSVAEQPAAAACAYHPTCEFGALEGRRNWRGGKGSSRSVSLLTTA